MRKYIIDLGERVLSGRDLKFEDAIFLGDVRGADIFFLFAYSSKIKEHFCGDKVDLCSIVSARTGGCKEDCAFCAQSAHHRTEVRPETNLDEDDILAKARKAKESGAHHFDMVTSGRGYKLDNPEFQHILGIYKRLKREVGIPLCACLGVIGDAEAQALSDVGVTRYNHNLETAESFFSNIVTTHSYSERVQTVKAAKKAGMEVCTGGIIGLGETFQQRIELAFALKELQVDSVPVNILNPIPGTPLAQNAPVTPLEALKTLAIFRFILPKQIIRFAGGREVNLRSLQALGFLAGVNGMLVGNYLTTGGQDIESDLLMLRDLELLY